MKTKVYVYEVHYRSIFVGRVRETFSTKEARDDYCERSLTPRSLGSNPTVSDIQLNEGSFFIYDCFAEYWENEGFKVIY